MSEQEPSFAFGDDGAAPFQRRRVVAEPQVEPDDRPGRREEAREPTLAAPVEEPAGPVVSPAEAKRPLLGPGRRKPLLAVAIREPVALDPPPAVQPILEARALDKRFMTPRGPLPILEGLTLKLLPGEMAALLGSSGAGKSTLLQILGGLDHPSGGQVLLNGQDLFALTDRERAMQRNRGIGFVYQFHHLLPEFTAVENVMMPLLIGRMDKRKARPLALAALAEVGLEERQEHKPGQLSGGEQQRVAIARAIATSPKLLLADEPTGNLDRRTAQDVFTLLRQLNRQRGLSCLMVTHNPELAASLDRRLMLQDGKLQEVV